MEELVIRGRECVLACFDLSLAKALSIHSSNEMLSTNNNDEKRTGWFAAVIDADIAPYNIAHLALLLNVAFSAVRASQVRSQVYGISHTFASTKGLDFDEQPRHLLGAQRSAGAVYNHLYDSLMHDVCMYTSSTSTIDCAT